MRKSILSTVIVATIFVLCGCISFNTTGLERLSKEQREKITRPTVALDQLPANDTIYLVNDSVVKEWIADKEYAIIHSYLTWCKGKYCINPALVVNNLRETGLPFLMIAGDYESKNGYHADYPFIAIDFDYYDTKNYSKGIERMFRALGCGDDWGNLYYLFHRGKYIGSAETLPELMTKYRDSK